MVHREGLKDARDHLGSTLGNPCTLYREKDVSELEGLRTASSSPSSYTQHVVEVHVTCWRRCSANDHSPPRRNPNTSVVQMR